MNVLSLFDGMSCGMIALERAGIHVTNYFASEIDKHAIAVSRANYPGIVRLGSVVDVHADQLPQIDLLIGGSPCQGFSTAGKELNFDDPRSRLFFEYVRLLTECSPRYFLLENVNMKKEYRDIISLMLGREPILINSALVSAQNRPRWYWTNIPGVEQPEDRGITAASALSIPNARIGQMQPFPRDYKKRGMTRTERLEFRTDGKANACLLSPTKNLLEIHGGHRQLSADECEILQTVPAGYTKSVSEAARYKMLGNGWTVDVIAHIFGGVKQTT